METKPRLQLLKLLLLLEISVDNGTPIINASSFESIGSTTSADTSDAYYPITDGYTGYTNRT